MLTVQGHSCHPVRKSTTGKQQRLLFLGLFYLHFEQSLLLQLQCPLRKQVTEETCKSEAVALTNPSSGIVYAFDVS